MVPTRGLEPLLHCLKGSCPSLDEAGKMERVGRVELPSSVWKTVALPLSYTRMAES